MRYRTKPFEVEAVRFTGNNAHEVMQLTDLDFMLVDDDDDPEIVASVWDKLHNTWAGVKAGQYIIKGMKGEFYPCDPEVFEAKYEAINE